MTVREGTARHRRPARARPDPVLASVAVDRRRFLLLLAAGLAGTAAVRGTDWPDGPLRPTAADTASRPASGARGGEPPPAPVVADDARGATGAEVPASPPTGVVDALPGEGRSVALTIDDGTSTEVVAAFVALARRTGVRLTFFPNGRYASWTDNAAELRPLVDSGQVVFGNHTWSHPDLTTLPDAEVAEEIRRNRDFLRDTFGVRDSPFFRPPYGARDERTDRIAADLGHPTIAMWNGTLGDSTVLTGSELIASAKRWFARQSIVVGHANHTPVTTVFDELLAVLDQRRLTTVTLADAWATPAQRLRGRSVVGAASTA
jgi:peptidoglycan/xylan/chitin deacetylase (PgdA/CDA1 family)